MQEKLNGLMRYENGNEEGSDDEFVEEEEEKETDPRWNALKKILNNN